MGLATANLFTLVEPLQRIPGILVFYQSVHLDIKSHKLWFHFLFNPMKTR